MYCDTCKKKLWEDGKCLAGYKYMPQTIEAAINQANHKGYWPCSFAPFREKFVEKYRPSEKVRIIHAD